MIRPTFIDFNPDELHYYPFIVSIDRCDGNLSLKVFDISKG